MNLVSLIITLVVIGVTMWVINNYLPMEANIKKILNIAVIIVVVLWLLGAVGLFNSFPNVRVGQIP